jgi:hypothetical protein
MEETRMKAEENARKTQGRADTKEKAAPSDQKDQQMQVDVDIRNTGQKKTINGFDTKEEVMTITVRENGKTLEEGGGLVLTMDLWITPAIPQMKEIQDFYARYRQQLSGSAMLSGVQVDQMAMITAMYPMMKQAIGRMNTEGDGIKGTPILQTLTFDSVKSAEQAAADARQGQAQSPLDDSKIPANVGSFLSGFAKRAAAKKVAGNEDKDRARVTILTSTNEVLKVATSLSSDELAIPAGFKETK